MDINKLFKSLSPLVFAVITVLVLCFCLRWMGVAIIHYNAYPQADDISVGAGIQSVQGGVPTHLASENGAIDPSLTSENTGDFTIETDGGSIGTGAGAVIAFNSSTGVVTTTATTATVDGLLRITGGSPADDYILAAQDSNGNADWEDADAFIDVYAWALDGNAGTTPGADFIGTTDAQPVEVRVNNSPVLTITTGNDVQLAGDNNWIGTGTDAAWEFSSAADAISTTAQSLRLQSATTDTTTAAALDIDKDYAAGSGTVTGVDIDIDHDPSANISGYGIDASISTIIGNSSVPVVLTGIRGASTVMSNSSASYTYGVLGQANSYGPQSGLGNVVEAVVGSSTIEGDVTGHAYGVYGVATCYGSGLASNGAGCDVNVIRGIKGFVNIAGAGEADEATGIFLDVKNEDTSTATTAKGVDVDMTNQGTMTNFYGVHIQTPSNSGTLGTNYGIRMEDQSQGTNHYSIYIDGAAPVSMLSGVASVGNYSLALGRGAQATANGTIVLTDNTDATFTASTIKTLRARFANGYDLCIDGACSAGVQIDSTGNISTSGVITLTGTLPWEDLRVPASSTRINPATSKPDFATFISGDLKTPSFDASSKECVTFQVQMPHAWKLESDVEAHVHYAPNTTNVGTVAWTLEYTLQEINGGAFPAPVVITATDTTDGVQWGHEYADFAAIDMTGIDTVSAMFVCALCRNAPFDTFTGEAALLEFDIHYQVDGFGSPSETVK